MSSVDEKQPFAGDLEREKTPLCFGPYHSPGDRSPTEPCKPTQPFLIDPLAKRMKPAWIILILLALTPYAFAAEDIVLRRDGRNIHLSGDIVVEASDGGVLVLTADGFLWAIQPQELLTRETSRFPFKPYNARALSEQLLSELPADFEIHKTIHYLVCHNTSRPYAQWCGVLYERLYRVFHNYWKRRGFTLHEPTFPLVAIVFKDQRSYEQYAASELGDATQSIIGYYSLHTNRVTMYDLTGLESLRARGGANLTAREINSLLVGPETERTVATIIHEATHQIAFNCGMHQRFADIPLWLSEGMAMYFEVPDLTSSRGWRNIGAVNQVRLREFQAHLTTRIPGSMRKLIQDDGLFKDANLARTAYPESWALAYFLIRSRPQQFVAYLQTLSHKQPLGSDSPDKRLMEFRSAFGKDLEQLDDAFLRHVSRLR